MTSQRQNDPLIDYVSAFVPKMTGEHFGLHVSSPREYLDAGAARYPLGSFGTAAKKLHDWTF